MLIKTNTLLELKKTIPSLVSPQRHATAVPMVQQISAVLIPVFSLWALVKLVGVVVVALEVATLVQVVIIPVMDTASHQQVNVLLTPRVIILLGLQSSALLQEATVNLLLNALLLTHVLIMGGQSVQMAEVVI
jgi:hypothetical protein